MRAFRMVHLSCPCDDNCHSSISLAATYLSLLRSCELCAWLMVTRKRASHFKSVWMNVLQQMTLCGYGTWDMVQGTFVCVYYLCIKSKWIYRRVSAFKIHFSFAIVISISNAFCTPFHLFIFFFCHKNTIDCKR